MILFGSQARGDTRPDSDWDLLVLLDKPKKEESDEDKAYEFVLMGWKYGTYLIHIAVRQVTSFCKSNKSIFSNSDLCTTNFRLVKGCGLYFRRYLLFCLYSAFLL